MGRFQTVVAKAGIVGELLAYMWERKLWWLIPMVTIIIIFGLLMIFVQGSAIAPFIYTLF